MTVTTPQHVDVAAYVLGILDEPDEAAFTQHLTECRRCRTEYRELADLPLLLDQLKTATPRRTRARQPAMPSKQLLGRVLDEVNTARRGQRTKVWLGAAAAVVVLVSVSLVMWQSGGDPRGPVAAPGPSSAQPGPTATRPLPTGVASARTVGATNPATGVTASIIMEPAASGTKLSMELRGVVGPMQCQLVAVSKLGESKIVAEWQVPLAGFGVPDSPEPLRVNGHTGLDLENIGRFDIRRDNGPDLLVVPT